MKNRNISNGMFVFVYSSHHLEKEPFSHLLFIVTTRETLKNIFCYMLYELLYVALFAELRSRDTQELSRIFRWFC